MLGWVAETLAWGAVAVVVWLVTLSSVTLPELCFAVAGGLLCGIVAGAGRRALGGSWRFRPHWLLWPVPVGVTLLAETAALYRLVVANPAGGEFTTIDLPDEETELAGGREAAATLALCSTPGSIVADNDPGEHRLTVHTLVSAGPRLAELIRR